MSLRLLAGVNSKEFELEMAKVLEAVGTIYQNFDDYETAYSHYQYSEKLLLKNNGYNELIGIYSKMANIFLRNSDIQRNKQIIEKCDAIIDKVTDKNVLAGYYTNRGNVSGYNEDYEKSDEYFQKALSILNETGNQYRLGMLYYNIGYFAVQRDNIQKGEDYYRMSLASFEKEGNKFDICDGILALGRVLYYGEKYDEAESYLLKSLSTAQQIGSKLLMRNTYITLSWLEHDRENYKAAFEYSEKGAEIDLELVSENTQKQLAFMEVKHETEKKEQHILSLIKEKRLITYLGITIGVLLFLLLLLLIARQRINRHKIESLKKEKQLVATQSLLDGETAERTRLARDLHDGLGGMLSAARFNLNGLKDGGTIESGDVDLFNKALNALDESIRELRRVAHNMMPDSLARYGLKPSLTDFCNSISIVKFNYFGGGDRLDSKLEIMIYRTVHELVNNALKHSDAKEIIVQIIQESDRIAITIQDDGHGFNASVPSKGSGLNNIRNRVGSYNGRIEIWSKEGEGTEISVEFIL
jgi:two-component system NarL family sensor kinase